MNKQITYAGYVPDHLQTQINETIARCVDVAKSLGYDYTIINKPIEVLFAKINAYAMVQPLLYDTGNMIKGHRLYISNNYIYTPPYLEKLVAHEFAHTLSTRDILRHETYGFNAFCNKYQNKYDVFIKYLTKEDIAYIESMKI